MRYRCAVRHKVQVTLRTSGGQKRNCRGWRDGRRLAVIYIFVTSNLSSTMLMGFNLNLVETGSLFQLQQTAFPFCLSSDSDSVFLSRRRREAEESHQLNTLSPIHPLYKPSAATYLLLPISTDVCFSLKCAPQKPNLHLPIMTIHVCLLCGKQTVII